MNTCVRIETPETKFLIPKMHGVELTRSDIYARNYSTVRRSLLFERTPRKKKGMVFQHGYCMLSINNPLKPLSGLF